MADENVVASMLRGLADLVGGGAKESAPTVTPEVQTATDAPQTGIDKAPSAQTGIDKAQAPKDAVDAPPYRRA